MSLLKVEHLDKCVEVTVQLIGEDETTKSMTFAGTLQGYMIDGENSLYLYFDHDTVSFTDFEAQGGSVKVVDVTRILATGCRCYTKSN